MTSVVVDREAVNAESQKAFDEASALHRAGKFSQAESLLRNAIALDPGNVNLRNARGVMFAAMDRHLDAVWCYRDALAYEGTAVGVWNNLGNALTQLNHLKSAISCHRRAIGLSRGGDPLLYHNLGTTLAEAGQHGEAVVAFSKALELNPAYHTARWDRGLSYLYLGNYTPGWADTRSARSPASCRRENYPVRPGTESRIRESDF